MNTSFKAFAFRTLTVSALTLAALSSANAAVFIRTGVVVVRPRPVIVAPVVAPVVVAPVVAPVVVVPVCRFVSVPVVNALTGVTYLVPRRVCN